MGAGRTDFELYVGGTQVTSDAEWDATWEERIDGVGQATVTLQDRNNDPTLLYGWNSRERMTMQTSASAPLPGWVLWDGETVDPDLNLPVGMPWRRWVLSGTDWNTVMDLRAVGVPDGNNWLSIDGGLTFQNDDPNAYNSATDQSTVRDLFNAYARLPDASAFGTHTFVNQYIPNAILNPNGPLLAWSATTIGGALSEMAGLASFPIYAWIDPDAEVHWQAFPDPLIVAGPGLPMLFPAGLTIPSGPATVTDYLPNGITSIGGRGLKFKLDFGYAPQNIYVNGVTDYVYNGGNVLTQGTGWGSNVHDTADRQIIVDAQSITRAQRDAIAAAYASFSARPRIRAQVTIGGRTSEAADGSYTPTPDGWRAGQLLTVIDARLPDVLNNKAWPITRVSGSLRPSVNARQYTLEFGDLPMGRFSQKYRQSTPKKITARKPAITHVVYFPSAVLTPSSTYTLYSQMVDAANQPVRQSGVPVVWTLTATDITGATVAEGSVTALTSVTDANGTTSATLVTGATGGVFYDVQVATAPQ